VPPPHQQQQQVGFVRLNFALTKILRSISKESKPTEATPPPPPPSTPSQELPYKSAMEPPKVTQAQQAPAVKQTIPITSIPVTPYQPIIQSSQQQDINKISGTRSETKVKMSRMRQTVANRLKTAQNTCAMLTTFNEINMG
jgi:2-oxoglutarate dehydrogenase E2 component (dihydrolipoamide succinyltransferase)